MRSAALILLLTLALFVPPAQAGPVPQSTTVCVQDEFGSAGIAGAYVWVNGTTAYGPTVAIPFTSLACTSVPLNASDKLVARLQVHEAASSRAYHGWAWRAYRTSLDFAADGTPILYTVSNPGATQMLTVHRARAVIGFNIVVAIDFDPTEQYLADLREGFRRANDYFFRATDGQMFFEQILFRTNVAAINGDDFIFHADYTVWPGTQVWSDDAFLNHPNININFPRFFNGNSGLTGSYLDSNGFRTFIHEWGHLGLSIADEYKDENGMGGTPNAMCTLQRSSWPWNQDTIASSIMDYQYTVSKFSSNFGSNPHNSHDGQAGLSRAWYGINYSPWDMIKYFYSDTYSTGVFRDWFLLAPEDRTWTPAHIMAGPDALPVPAWATQSVAGPTGGCVVPVTSTPNASSTLWVAGESRYVAQGPIGPDGKLDILGVHTGDLLIVSGKIDFGWISLPWFSAQSLQCQSKYNIVLKPIATWGNITVQPCNGLGCLHVHIQLNQPLYMMPQVLYQMDGMRTIGEGQVSETRDPRIWDAYLPVPQGQLPRDQHARGQVVVNLAQNPNGGDVASMIVPFQMGWYGPGMDTTTQEADGPARGGMPTQIAAQAGAAADTIVVWQMQYPQMPAALPGQYWPVGLPFRLNTRDGEQLSAAVLTMPWDDAGMGSLMPETATLFHWNEATNQWDRLETTRSPEHHIATARTDASGIFVLAARPPVWLPLIIDRSR